VGGVRVHYSGGGRKGGCIKKHRGLEEVVGTRELGREVLTPVLVLIVNFLFRPTAGLNTTFMVMQAYYNYYKLIPIQIC